MDAFSTRACTLCFTFLFPKYDQLRLVDPDILGEWNGSAIVRSEVPHPSNDSSVTWVCSHHLKDKGDCERWQDCCRTAVKCCDRQLQTPALEGNSSFCSRTWDGFSCIEDTPAGNTTQVSCPSFMSDSTTDKKYGTKTCLNDGNWFTLNGSEWTDYRPCANKESHLTSVYLCLGCNLCSLLTLLPAVISFVGFRDLRRQERIRLHTNFFISLALANFVNLLWFGFVHYDVLIRTTLTETVLSKNPAWCRLLSYLKVYTTSTGYFWMFCEGYYLRRLISNAFHPPSSLLALYGIGWGLPVISSLLFATVRSLYANEKCWVHDYKDTLWIIYIPNLSCLLMNLAFLCDILRVLMFGLHSHPHEPSSFRRGLKAAFMLIPLFGVQLFLTIYRPDGRNLGALEYEYATYIIKNSQGVFVSLIFCFFNNEVMAHLQQLSFCCHKKANIQQASHSAHFTQMSTVEERDDIKGVSAHHTKHPRHSKNLPSHSFVELCEYSTPAQG